MLFSLTVTLFAISAIDCQLFCDKDKKDNLIDFIFNFNESIYVFRRPNTFWILSVNDSDPSAPQDEWYQKAGPIARNVLFEGLSDDLAVDTVFPISSYLLCAPDNDICDDTGSAFNPLNITFVIHGDEWSIYRRQTETQFVAITGNNTDVPWEAGYGQNIVKDILEIGSNETIWTSMLRPPLRLDTQRLIVLTDQNVYSFEISDGLTSRKHIYDEPTPEVLKNVSIVGWIFYNFQPLLFASNNVWRFPGFAAPEDMATNYWDQFNCDRQIPSTTTPMSTITADAITGDGADQQTGTSTPDSLASGSVTESDSSGSDGSSDDGVTSELPPSGTDATDEATHSGDIPANSFPPDNPEMPDQYIPNDEEKRRLYRGNAIVLFLCVMVCAALLTCCAGYGFSTLSTEKVV